MRVLSITSHAQRTCWGCWGWISTKKPRFEPDSSQNRILIPDANTPGNECEDTLKKPCLRTYPYTQPLRSTQLDYHHSIPQTIWPPHPMQNGPCIPLQVLSKIHPYRTCKLPMWRTPYKDIWYEHVLPVKDVGTYPHDMSMTSPQASMTSHP